MPEPTASTSTSPPKPRRPPSDVVEGLRAVAPHVFDNPYIPHAPHPKQLVCLGWHLHRRRRGKKGAIRLLFGGAAGGGKSDVLLMCAAQYVHVPGYSALIIRRTLQEMKKGGAILARAKEWWKGKPGVHYSAEDRMFTFPSGATIEFGYLQDPDSELQYQGGAFHFVGVDELTQWKDLEQPDYLASRIRRLDGVDIPGRYYCTANPGGPGHVQAMERYIGKLDHLGNVIEPAPYDFLPSKLQDNPSLDREEYEATLAQLHPTRRKQLLEGDWRARDAGDYFRAEWWGPLLDPATDLWEPEECTRVRWWDLAASEKKTAAYTAGVRMAKHRSGVRAVEHVRSFRAVPGKRDDLILQTARADGKSVVVGLEIEGGSGGQYQFDMLSARLQRAGFRVAGARPKAELTDRESKTLYRNPLGEKGKMGRADPVASCLYRGYVRRGEIPESEGGVSPEYGVDRHAKLREQRSGIRCFAGRWTQPYFDILEGFPDAATCDEVDATSGAYSYLEAHGVGGNIPLGAGPAARVATDSPDVHPEDREVETRSSGRHWSVVDQ